MRAVRILWLAIGLMPLAAPAAAAAGDDEAQKRVLVVYSTRRDTQLPTLGDREMPRLLGEALSAKPDYYSEYVDGARFPEARFVFAGDGRLRGEIEARIRTLGLERNVVLTGFHAHPEQLIALADLCMLASAREGLPRMLDEDLHQRDSRP